MSNPVTDLVATFQQLSTEVPELIQPVIVAAAATIPFIEGELAAGIGVVAGLHPVVAALAGVIGNLVSVALLVFLGSGVRKAVGSRSSGSDRKRSPRM